MRPLVSNPSSENERKGVANSAGFTPLLSPDSLKNEEKSSGESVAGSSSDACEKDVELVVEQGVVKKIRVRCSCGEITEINCRYPE